jgi:hypothetical protein
VKEEVRGEREMVEEEEEEEREGKEFGGLGESDRR